MAEVPEVETIVRDLRAAVVGRRIDGAHVLRPEAIRFPAPDAFERLMAGRIVEDATRRAKHILMPVSGGLTLAIHCMLWGTLRLHERGAARPSATLVVWTLDRHAELWLLDTLGYARAALAPSDELARRLDLDSLGPEALDADFGPAVLTSRLARRRAPIKTVLLNQKVLAGLGNRDADESLWQAGIDPRRPAGGLTPAELERLTLAIQVVLDEGIRLRGTQRDLFGVPGKALHRRNIFERAGRPCPRCGTRIHHARIGARNTYWCPRCQS